MDPGQSPAPYYNLIRLLIPSSFSPNSTGPLWQFLSYVRSIFQTTQVQFFVPSSTKNKTSSWMRGICINTPTWLSSKNPTCQGSFFLPPLLTLEWFCFRFYNVRSIICIAHAALVTPTRGLSQFLTLSRTTCSPSNHTHTYHALYLFR